MKLPDWDRSKQAWDRYNAFHIGVSASGLCTTNGYSPPPFVMFDTGELILTRSGDNEPHIRQEYPALNVALYGSRDKGCPDLWTPDGELVTQAWLHNNGAQQYLLIDHDSKRVVGCGPMKSCSRDELLFPMRFYRENRSYTTPPKPPTWYPTIYAYFPGPCAYPVGSPIVIKRSNREELTEEERKHVDMIVLTAKAGLTLTEHPASKMPSKKFPWYSDPKIEKAPLEKVLAATTYTDLDENTLRSIFFSGVGRKPVEYPHLLTEQP